MSISNVSAAPPVTVSAANQPKAPEIKNEAVSSRTPEPTPPAPLPPGQGMRVDQLC